MRVKQKQKTLNKERKRIFKAIIEGKGNEISVTYFCFLYIHKLLSVFTFLVLTVNSDEHSQTFPPKIN